MPNQKSRERKPEYRPRPRPLGAFRFIIEMEQGGVVGAFSQFSGVKMQVDTIQARSGSDIRGVQESIPSLTRYQPVTLTKGVIGDNEFLDWLFAVSAGPYTGPLTSDCRTLNVVALNDEGERGVVWSLLNALPIGYELTPMDGGRSEVLSESLTFAIHGVTRTVVSGASMEVIDMKHVAAKRPQGMRPPGMRPQGIYPQGIFPPGVFPRERGREER